MYKNLYLSLTSNNWHQIKKHGIKFNNTIYDNHRKRYSFKYFIALKYNRLKIRRWDKKSDSEKWKEQVFAKNSTRRTFINKGRLMMKRRSVVDFNRVSFRLNRRFASRVTSASLNAKLISRTSISFCQSEPLHLKEQYANIEIRLPPPFTRNLWENFFRYFVDTL